MKEGPLDMRMDQGSGGKNAADIVATYDEEQLADVFWKYGEIRQSRRLAKAIAIARKKRPITTTKELVDVVGSSGIVKNRTHNPSTLVFQALRIEVNDELSMLEKAVSACIEVLAPGGILAVLTFHSLEDRIVKHAFKRYAENIRDEKGKVREKSPFVICTKKPLLPSREEIRQNRRASCTKLRAIERRAK